MIFDCCKNGVVPSRWGWLALWGYRHGGIAGIAWLFLAACATPPPPAEQAKSDPAREAAYAAAVEQLAALNRQAEDQLKRGRRDDAAAAISRGLPLEARLLAASRPTLAAMEAVSDLDDLYARMLLSNGHEVWARSFYEKNAARWKLWQPQTEDTARRLSRAQAGIAECDRRMKR
jgi:hypothetical protein